METSRLFEIDSVIWRKDFLVEHYGEIEEVVPGCPSLSHQGLSNCYPDCVCEDSYNNTFRCLRTMSVDVDLVYCEFVDDERFVEVYDLRKDPFELNNIAEQLGTEILLDLKKRMFQLLACVGSECR